jgi:hypothetical protein
MTFSCSSCGATYPWSASKAGKKAKCKCGAVVLIPASAPTPVHSGGGSEGEESDGDGFNLFALKPDAVTLAPEASLPVRPPPVVVSAAPAPAARAGKPKQTLDYRSGKTEKGDALEANVRNLYSPLIVLAIGIALEISTNVYFTPSKNVMLRGATVSVIVAVLMTFNVIIMSAGIAIAAKFREIDLRPFHFTILKLAAVAIMPSALLDLAMVPLGHVPMGWILAWIVSFSAYFMLIGFFFDLDQEDTWYLVKIIFAIRILIFIGLAAIAFLAIKSVA